MTVVHDVWMRCFPLFSRKSMRTVVTRGLSTHNRQTAQKAFLELGFDISRYLCFRELCCDDQTIYYTSVVLGVKRNVDVFCIYFFAF